MRKVIGTGKGMRKGGEGIGRKREADNKKSSKVNDPSRAAFIYVVKFD